MQRLPERHGLRVANNGMIRGARGNVRHTVVG